MNFVKTIFTLIIFSSLFFSACKKDELLTDSSAKLDFSVDSILFDTVFTQVGSTTRSFRIYNNHDQPINISKIFLGAGSNSQYRINVDGSATTSSNPIIRDVEIMAGDSLFVFVQVTVDPTGSTSPLLIKDSVVFETNGNIQDVKLTAIGQDVYLVKPDRFPTSGFPDYSIIGRSGFDTILPNDKPYVVFGYAVVDSACKLTIQQNTKMYFYNNACLYVYKDGSLVVNGTFGNEPSFQGYRLESAYKDTPAQWRGIWLSALSKNNSIDWAIIKNANIGIQVDTVASLTQPTLKLTNTIIKNMQIAALYGQGARIWSNNCVYANCGLYVTALTLGGNYKFEHCTFANFWSNDDRQTPTIALNNYYVSGSNLLVRSLDSCYFGNCIIYGDITEEIGMDSTTLAGPGFFSYEFENCILKTSRNTTNSSHYTDIIKNSNPQFKDSGVNDYQLKTNTSPAIDAGSTGVIIPIDLKNNIRNGVPDIGAYEFIP
jgi:hypothetical protein